MIHGRELIFRVDSIVAYSTIPEGFPSLSEPINEIIIDRSLNITVKSAINQFASGKQDFIRFISINSEQICAIRINLDAIELIWWSEYI